jgi:hypothetical protein
MGPSAISWIPEENSEAGGFEATGFLSILGQPKLRSVELLVRETAQNSWDARIGKSLVSMTFSGSSCRSGDIIHNTLRNEIFSDLPKKDIFSGLFDSLAKDEIPLLIIRDSNSHGLGGVTSAKVATGPKTTNRYRRFLLNIGEQKYEEKGGGAYGYGRSICFAASHSNTAIIYTRTKDDLPDYESRLIAVGYGKSFDRNGIRHNGRHWWTSSSHPGKPVIGDAADQIASRLGIKPYGKTESGTTIAIIDPSFGNDIKDAMTAIANSIELHLWPKYLSPKTTRRQPQMTFKVECNDEPVAIRQPWDIYPLKHYARAFESSFKRHEANDVTPKLDDPGLKSTAVFIRSDAQSNPLGQLSVVPFPKISEIPQEEDADETSQIRKKLNDLQNNVFLVRDPDLVVTYFDDINTNTDAEMGTAGAFKASAAANEDLRSAEPPSHDSWSTDHQDKDVQRRVKAVLRGIQNFISKNVNPPIKANFEPLPANNSQAAETARAIGNLIWAEPTSGLTGGGDDDDSGGNGGGGGGGLKGRCTISKPFLGTNRDGQLTVTWDLEFSKTKSELNWEIALELVSDYGKSFEPVDETSELPCFEFEFDGRTSYSRAKSVLRHKQLTSGNKLSVRALVEKGMMTTINIKRLA